MIRKQIYLTEDIDNELTTLARREKKSVAQLLREILEKSLRTQKKRRSGAEVLLELAKNASKKGPKDLSTNLFDYLYGDKSSNYGKNAPKLTKAENRRIDKSLNEQR